MANHEGDVKKKTVTMYAIWTSDNEFSSSIKAYCATYELAEKEAKNHVGFYGVPPSIHPIEVIVEMY